MLTENIVPVFPCRDKANDGDLAGNRIKDSREVIPDPMRSEESMKLIEEIFKKCNGCLLYTSLLESDKTIYYERCAFVIEVPTIYETVHGNRLTLTIGGVRAYNLSLIHI